MVSVDAYKAMLPKQRKYDEQKLHIAVVEHLRTAFPDILFTHPANQARSPQEGAKLKRMGVRAGVADLLLWWHPNGYGAIELKARAGTESLPQKTFGFLFTRIGGKYAVCKSVGEVHKILIGWGAKPVHNAVKEPDLQTQEQKFERAIDFYKP